MSLQTAESQSSQREAALYKFWDRTKNAPDSRKSPAPDEWNEQVFYLSQSGIGTEEALKFLYTRQPSFDAFLEWLRITHLPANENKEIFEGPALTQADHEFWKKNGYLVVPGVIPAEQCAATRAAIWEYLGANAGTPKSWYTQNGGKNGMMLSLFQHPTLDSNRQQPRIRKIYEELYNSTDIYLLVDKVSFNPPETATYQFTGSPLHWDVSLQLPIPFILQGLLYLNDVTAGDGAFHCVPGIHNTIESWMNELPAGTDPRVAAVNDLKPVPVPGKAGDLVIWHQALPHCATPNKGTLPRMVQYVAYKPVKVWDNKAWK